MCTLGFSADVEGMCVLCVPPSLPFLYRIGSSPLVVPSSSSSLQTSRKGTLVTVSVAVCVGFVHCNLRAVCTFHFILTLSCAHMHMCMHLCQDFALKKIIAVQSKCR